MCDVLAGVSGGAVINKLVKGLMRSDVVLGALTAVVSGIDVDLLADININLVSAVVTASEFTSIE